MTNKWQCIKCKLTKKQRVKTTIVNDTVIVVKKDIPKIMCHDHIMRNLSEENYKSENGINDSGARDENTYRKEQ